MMLGNMESRDTQGATVTERHPLGHHHAMIAPRDTSFTDTMSGHMQHTSLPNTVSSLASALLN